MRNRFERFAIYAMPQGALLEAGAQWLGWNSVTGIEVAHPHIPALPVPAAELTRTPRKYRFHGTIKPPFRLAEGQTADALATATAALCAKAAPVTIPALEVQRIGGFVAIVPAAPAHDLAKLAGQVVRDLDHFRAPAPEAELARRRKAGLSERQKALLLQWGYPYVMEEFRFHLTLTGSLDRATADSARDALAMHFEPLLPRPFLLDSLCLTGEDAAGRFHMVHRYPLAG